MFKEFQVVRGKEKGKKEKDSAAWEIGVRGKKKNWASAAFARDRQF